MTDPSLDTDTDTDTDTNSDTDSDTGTGRFDPPVAIVGGQVTGTPVTDPVAKAADGSGSADGSPERAATDFISWDTAQRVAGRVAGRERWSPRERVEMEEEFARLTPVAERLVTELTGLVPAWGPARPVVVSRAGWVTANAESFERLLTPLLSKLPIPEGPLRSLPRAGGTISSLGKTVTGAELGALLGWMSGRVLGQYDLIFAGAPAGSGESGPTVAESAEDAVYFVGPNIAVTEARHGFPPRQFRMWIALHELTHRAQFTGVPWMRAHFMSLVEEALATSIPEPDKLAEGVKRAMSALRSGSNPLDSGAGLVGLFMSDEAKAVFARVQGMMSLLEGHGDIVMDRAGAAEIPLAAHFSRVLAERRKTASRTAKMIMQLIGMDAKIRQYANGEAFVKHVESVGGKALFDRVWQGPEWLPDAREIAEPDSWVARVEGKARVEAKQSAAPVVPDLPVGAPGTPEI